MKRSIYTVVLLLAVGGATAQTPPTPAAENNPEMDRIYAQDQKARENFNKMSGAQLKQMSAGDAQRRARVRQLLAARALHTGKDFEHASFVFQHGDTANDILMAHILAMVAMARGEIGAKWIAAATLDRYLQRKDTPQVFGTQYGWKGEGPHKWNQAPYDREFLSDALRSEFCVSSYADQQLNVKALNEGKEPVSPDGCR